MSQLTLQPRLWFTCVLQFICDSPFDSSVNSTHRLVRLPRSGSVALSSRATVTWLVRIDLQISPVKLLPAVALPCVFQCFVPVEACFCRDVSANSASAFMWSLCFTGHLRFAVRQFCELDTSTCVTSAFWLSCSFVTCDSHVVGEGRWSNPGGGLKVNVSQD